MNMLKDRLARGEVTRGLWQNLPGPEAAEIAARAGFDWIVLDGEHGPWDPVGLRLKLIAAPEGVVRIPALEDWIVKQALDLGARTLLVPMVDTAEQARAAVAAARYPPEGRRGVGAMVARAGRWGADPGYLDRANDEVSIWVQAESRMALENLEEICATPGVDCVFIGPADLAWDMGLRPDAPEFQSILAEAIARIAGCDTPPGIFAAQPQRWIEAGARVVCLGSDAMVLTSGLAALR
ncbi:HpcH/HpaI aldolase family protein [Jannaschia seohaensis]|uniref:4-hydroxy-2-oxoheptanedioate aldolase n=1 Tax=Jannaschia seohaensis TaxID=475081 RepID=A0A2Y9AQ74_9RHOB|nr:aldolase/citrate lyase family protein [Jannaschia seohaensis]PWJ18047.1 4-hydroxy-2-oxoheptanedioate aldolase [Jannaschia seohaensis]SSA46570.1 4-hydroxy-2-oxoheptanedioate aldolase [Jannaschia seohaensis]